MTMTGPSVVLCGAPYGRGWMCSKPKPCPTHDVVQVPPIDCNQPSRFDYAYALVDAIQGDSRGLAGNPLRLAAEHLGHVAASVYAGHYATGALRALQAVRQAQIDA
jgi:hypothetical protein